MAEQTRKRVVALIRVSTLKQIKDKEADYQRNQIRLTCSMKNLELVKEFPLENISGLVVRHTDQFRALKKQSPVRPLTVSCSQAWIAFAEQPNFRVSLR